MINFLPYIQSLESVFKDSWGDNSRPKSNYPGFPSYIVKCICQLHVFVFVFVNCNYLYLYLYLSTVFVRGHSGDRNGKITLGSPTAVIPSSLSQRGKKKGLNKKDIDRLLYSARDAKSDWNSTDTNLAPENQQQKRLNNVII